MPAAPRLLNKPSILAPNSEASAATIDAPETSSVIGPVLAVALPLNGAVTFAFMFYVRRCRGG